MWRFRLLGRLDLLAAALAIVFLGGSVLLAINGQWRILPNFGFGSDWQCTYPGRGGPVCIQEPGKAH